MADMFAPLVAQLKANPKTIVFTEGNDPRILEAASKLLAEGVLKVVMVGNEAECKAAAAAGNFDISAAEIIDPENYAGFDEMVNTMVELRKGKQTAEECTALLKKSNYFGTMLVKMGKADCLLGGATYSTADTIRPALQLVKTEMWYVLDASKDAKLVYGLKRERTEQQMRDAIAKGTLMKDLQWVPVKKDDLFFIEAGTIHAIGAGALVAEIQENSNLTYRLYDYDRVGKDGKKRELHIDKALDVANLKSSAEPKQPLRVLKYRQGIASELLTRCKYFEVYRMIVNTERRQKVHYRADEIAFRVLLCVNGCGTISYEGGNLPFYKGDCIFVPADSEVLTIHGQAQFLDVRG